MYRYVYSCGLSVKYVGHIAKHGRISIFLLVISCNTHKDPTLLFDNYCCLDICVLTSIFIEHQSISLIMKNLPSPPIFLIIRDKVTCSPTKHSPQSRLFNFLHCRILFVDTLDVSLYVPANCKFPFVFSLRIR